MSKLANGILIAGSLVALCQPMTAHAEDGMAEETVVQAETMQVVEEVVETAELAGATEEVEAPTTIAQVAEEGAVLLGDFKVTYYCCERYKHICGKGTGLTASGKPVEPGRSIAVDPDVIPLGSRVWIDFGDGEGWHEYSADDVGSKVEGNHVDISIATHHEALHQTKLAGQVCFVPPSINEEVG